LGLYEADRADTETNGKKDRSNPLENELNMFEAGICIGILISLLVLIITVCDKPESLTGKTFLMYALAAILLLAGLICAIVVEATEGGDAGRTKKEADDSVVGPSGLRIASYVLAGAELLILIIGAIAPFIC